jgi:hypothetical protein
MTSIDPKLRKALTGISGILVTPFDQEDKLLYLRNDGIGLDAIEQLCRIEGVAGVKWAAPTQLRLAGAIRRGDPDIVWVGGLAEIWAPPLCARRAGLHVRPDQCLARPFGRHPRCAGRGRLRTRQPTDRCDVSL